MPDGLPVFPRDRFGFVSRETIGLWVKLFDDLFARCVRHDRPSAADKWHIDEVVISIDGTKHGLWRAVDVANNVLDILATPRRKSKAARRFLKTLIKRFGRPRVVITNWLRSYIKPIRREMPGTGPHGDAANAAPGSVATGVSPASTLPVTTTPTN